MAYVIKINCGNRLRRLTYQSQPGAEGGLTFEELEAKTRELFHLPATAMLVVTYRDKDNDVVTMANGEDLKDACVYQSLNPVRLNVEVSKDDSNQDHFGSRIGQRWAQVLENVCRPEAMKEVAEACEQFAEVTSPAQVPEVVERIMSTVASQLQRARTSSGAACPPAPSPSSAPSTEFDDKEPSQLESSSRISHIGVTCDGCGMNPIVGPRFKSSTKFDYDLCVGCFEKLDMASASEYSRIDKSPYSFRPGGPSPGGWRMMGPKGRMHAGRPFGHGYRGPHGGGRGYSMNGMGCHGNQANGMGPGFGHSYGCKLDARFVRDVTIFDGTELAPGTRFTKIWRLRNSGNVPWPAHSKLVHVGGDEMGPVFLTPVELPPEGLAPEAEIDVSVDLVAPEQPGRYVSHWRLASPCGPKFGHRIWVLIQVLSKENMEKPAEELVVIETPERDYNLVHAIAESAEPATSTPTESSAADARPKPEDAALEPERPTIVEALPLADSGNGNDVRVKNREAAMVSSALGDAYSLVDVANDVAIVIEAPVDGVEARLREAALVSAVGTATVDTGTSASAPPEPALKTAAEPPALVDGEVPVVTEDVAAQTEEDSSSSTALLEKLEAMGFTNRKLNFELLERNQSDLRKTLDDLCEVETWDPILDELEEMGFYDTDMNRRLMLKNRGNVKRVVKELVQMYRDLAGNGKKIHVE